MIQRFTALAATLVLLAFPLAANAQSMGSMANSTAMPRCSAGDPVVWVNTGTKVYHLQGDRYFGKTKAGMYACTSKAVAMGAHAAKSKMGKKSAMKTCDTDAPDAMASAAPMTGKKKHRKTGMPMASPTP